MTDGPAEYIAALKQAHPRQPVTREMAEQALEGEDMHGMDIAAVLAEINDGDYVERLLKSLWPRLPDDVRALIESGDIAVGEIGLPTVDARAIPVGDGHAIIIHRGTHQFVYRIARILSTRFVPHEGGEPALPIEDTARIIGEAFAWYVATGQAFGPEYEVASDQRKVASLITLDAMNFLLCHELAHAVTDREAPPEYRAQADLSTDVDEHAADAIGAMWALGLGSGEEPRSAFEMATRYGGIEFVLQIWAVLEKLGHPFADSHPRAEERLLIIQHFVAERCDGATWETLTSLAQGTRQLFDRIGELLMEPGQYEAFVAAGAAALVAELDDLLERCATIPIPDYATFYVEAGRIFSSGYPEQLLWWIGELASGFRRGADEDESWSDERIRQYHKFKLLIGYVEQLNEPARAQFRAALGLGG